MGINWDTIIFKHYQHLFQADQKAESDMNERCNDYFLEGIWKLSIRFHGNISTNFAHVSKTHLFWQPGREAVTWGTDPVFGPSFTHVPAYM